MDVFDFIWNLAHYIFFGFVHEVRGQNKGLNNDPNNFLGTSWFV